ncbi:MAG: hypothetical protein M1835_003201, partial [Candelina submexicana]
MTLHPILAILTCIFSLITVSIVLKDPARLLEMNRLFKNALFVVDYYIDTQALDEDGCKGNPGHIGLKSTHIDTNTTWLDSNGDRAADAKISYINTDPGDLPGSFGNPTDHQDSRLHPASFLSLPLELRETICSYLLLHKHRVRPHRARQMLRYCCDVHPEREYQDRVGENLGVLRVSHLLYDETTSYLYGSNESLFSDDTFEYERPHLVHYNDITDNFHYWLLTIGATNQRKIKHLIIGSCDTFLRRGNSDVEEDHVTMDDS